MNNTLWTIGLILQVLLLAALLRGGLARKLPFFTALISFYVARSLFLFAGSGQMEDEVYIFCEQALSFIDILLQIVVAWELLRGGRSDPGVRTQAAPVGRLALLFSALIVGSAALAWGLSEISPLNRSRQFDRGVVLTAALMLLVAACTFFRRKGPDAAAAKRVLGGYVLLAVASISAQVGKTLAQIQRNPQAYYLWSYVAIVAYLAVLGFWLVAMSRVSTRPLLKWPRKTTADAG
ncbi:MAG TPA: hypothetical protein VME23_09815 [Terracidiphilus sp.]|nr:hypothetical protein [Terracidiphilus sp.]